MGSLWTPEIVERRLPALVDELRSGDVTLFVGAGLSRNAGLPLWDELMLPLAIELGLDHDTDPITIAQYYSDAHAQGRYLLNSHIVRQLRRVAPKFSFLHALVKELPLRAIVTTNFDDLIERALSRDPERPFRVIITDEDLSYHSERDLPVVKANGCVGRPGSLVLTRQDFESYADRRPILTSYLKSLMATSTLLFLGTSMRDPAFATLGAEVLRHLSQHRRAFYLVVPTTNKYEMQDYRKRGIELIDLEATQAEIGDSLTILLESLVRLARARGLTGEPSPRRSRNENLLMSRLSPGLSLQVDPIHIDRIHRYSLVERTDLLDYQTGDFVSLRRLSGTNQSDLLSTHLVYSETSERKLSFAEMEVLAFDTATQEPLEVESLEDQNTLLFTHGYKVFFRRPLSPGESFDIVYRITLPGELRDLSQVDEVMSVSLARISRGIDSLRFNVCLDFSPQAVAIECVDWEGSRLSREGVPPKIETYEPVEWYERQLNLDWEVAPTVIRWSQPNPQGVLYIVNYRA